MRTLKNCLSEIFCLNPESDIIEILPVTEFMGEYWFNIQVNNEKISDSIDNICKFIGYGIDDNQSEFELLEGDLTIALNELKEFLNSVII